MKNTTQKHWLVIGSTAVITAALLSACSSSEPKEPPAQPAAEAPAPAPAQKPVAKAEPDDIVGEVIVVTAKVKGIDKKHRILKVKYPDGKIGKVRCGQGVHNFDRIRKGDDVTATFLETVEIAAVNGTEKLTESATEEIRRAPASDKPGFSEVEAITVKAAVVAINHQTGQATLKTPEGKLLRVKAGRDTQGFNEINKGDTVIARLTEAVEVEITSPGK
jgi:hypothetical protein